MRKPLSLTTLIHLATASIPASFFANSKIPGLSKDTSDFKWRAPVCQARRGATSAKHQQQASKQHMFWDAGGEEAWCVGACSARRNKQEVPACKFCRVEARCTAVCRVTLAGR